jgi:hypothetical protein
VKHDGLTVHEAIEVFVQSQIEGTGEGMVQMDYEEFEEALLRIALKMSVEPRVTVARKVAEFAKGEDKPVVEQPDAEVEPPDADPEGGSKEAGGGGGGDKEFVDQEEDERLLAVVEAIASCRGVVNKWNEERKHRWGGTS